MEFPAGFLSAEFAAHPNAFLLPQPDGSESGGSDGLVIGPAALSEAQSDRRRLCARRTAASVGGKAAPANRAHDAPLKLCQLADRNGGSG